MPTRTRSGKRKFRRRVAEKIEGLIDEGKRGAARTRRKVRRRRAAIAIGLARAARRAKSGALTPARKTGAKRTKRTKAKSTAQRATKR
jgi:hypothetical protein